ncbi:protein ARV 2-like [Rosa chinensis]|uniref:protein ARV 2-like n=1 Tax=Rosa chinensis TaxID=74649 RepID=UPI001AD8BB6F|nr:protein ARV 2-like [Rosa chinensis]
MLMDVVFGCFMCLSTFLFAPRALFSTFPRSLGYKDDLLALLISSYFRMFLFAILVRECPSMTLNIDLFVLSSNTVALKVITRTAMSRCIAAFFSAHVVKSLRTFRCFITFCLLYIRRCFFENKYFCYVLQRQGQ